ncbi:hypothetical protein [Ideonella sp.]|uniref:hypothetical protein n=1 Tax=Ideonella sp. TaxID=1929293 RepID=UPI003BB5F040
MNWLNKLPGHRRAEAGLEWRIWRKLGAIAFWGTALPALLALGMRLFGPDNPTPSQVRSAQLFDYILLGVLMLHWTLWVTLAIGCVIVMLMKGPGYVADAFPPEERTSDSG